MQYFAKTAKRQLIENRNFTPQIPRGVPPLRQTQAPTHPRNTNPLHSEKISLVKKLAILGSTGSIGHSTLSICESFPDRYQVISLAAGQNLEVAFAQCLRWR